MHASQAVRNSPLAWREGPFAADGWIEVDKTSLQHTRYPNVFGVGDVNGVPIGSDAARLRLEQRGSGYGPTPLDAGRNAYEGLRYYDAFRHSNGIAGRLALVAIGSGGLVLRFYGAALSRESRFGSMAKTFALLAGIFAALAAATLLPGFTDAAYGDLAAPFDLVALLIAAFGIGVAVYL